VTMTLPERRQMVAANQSSIDNVDARNFVTRVLEVWAMKHCGPTFWAGR